MQDADDEGPTGVSIAIASAASIAENADVSDGVKVGDIVVTGDLLGNDFAVSDTDSFEVRDGANGKELWYIGDSPDFETQASYVVTVTVSDPNFPGPDVSTEFTLNVTNVDEAPSLPTFTPNPQAFDGDGKLPELTAADVVVGFLSATDPEGKDVTFTVPDNDAFVVVGNELRVKDASGLDFEAGGAVSITVTATDDTGNSSEQTFTFTLGDLPEAPIGVSFSNFKTAIDENTDASAGIEVATVGIIDPDGGSGTLGLDGTDADFFELVTVKGQTKLVFKSEAPPDFETKSHYDVIVTTTKGAGDLGEPASQAFTFSVNDLDEAPTAVTLSNTVSSIAENTAVGTAGVKVADIAVEDDKLGGNNLDLTGDDAGFFEIRTVGNAASLWFVGPNDTFAPDFEAKTQYDVTVTVDGVAVGGAVDASQDFSLAVTNVNEAPAAPALSGGAIAAEYAAAGTAVGTLSSSDPDAGAALTFSLVNDAGGRFQLSGNSLQVKNGFLLDFEQAAAHQVVVRVSDGVLTVDKTFTIAVGDVATEVTVGSGDSDTFVGGGNGNSLRGGLGNDRLVGGGGVDSPLRRCRQRRAARRRRQGQAFRRRRQRQALRRGGCRHPARRQGHRFPLRRRRQGHPVRRRRQGHLRLRYEARIVERRRDQGLLREGRQGLPRQRLLHEARLRQPGVAEGSFEGGLRDRQQGPREGRPHHRYGDQQGLHPLLRLRRRRRQRRGEVRDDRVLRPRSQQAHADRRRFLRDLTRSPGPAGDAASRGPPFPSVRGRGGGSSIFGAGARKNRVGDRAG